MDMAFGVCDFRREGVQLRFTLRREERGERREGVQLRFTLRREERGRFA
jgi:hypothetical protein